MKDFFKTGKFKILAALTAVIIGVMIYSLTKGGYASDGSSFLSFIFEPAQRISTSISENVSNKLDMLINAKQYYEENQLLREQLNSIYNDIIDYDKLKSENAQLKELLELKEENQDFVFSSPCTVISRTANDPYGSFTIDKGSSDGIAPYDPVITSEGLIGLCYDVSLTTTRVQTLYSPKTAVGVISVRTKVTGVIEGDYELSKDGCCRMSYINKFADLKKGDIIITSGSETFPEGQLVGIIENVEMEDSGLSKYAVVRPVIEPENTSTVFVITDFNGQETGNEH